MANQVPAATFTIDDNDGSCNGIPNGRPHNFDQSKANYDGGSDAKKAAAV
ncbi:hypothetical protein [Methyloglobulus morosus]|nr:hypothetical protein [Methyloglobulus morosus]